MSRLLIIIAAVSVAIATAAIAHGGSAPGVAQQAALSGPFLGSYTARLTVSQAAARGDARMAGRFTLVLRRNGTYFATSPLDGRGGGRLTALPGRRLRFSRDSGCIAGGFERREGGVYRWSLHGRRLTLRLVSEGACTGRTQTLTYPIWRRTR